LRTLVTGHNGYIGSVLVPLLQQAGQQVVGIDSDLSASCTFGPEPPAVEAGLTRHVQTGRAPRSLRIAMVGLRGIPATHGGIEGAVDALAARLVARGNDVTVYARRGYCKERPESYRGVRLRYLPQIDTKHLEAASHTAIAMSHVVARERPDIVHVHAVGPALFSFMPRLARVPCVATVHALDARREKWGPLASAVLRFGERMAATVPDRSIAVSRLMRDYLARRYRHPITYIPNGVDIEAMEPPQPVEGLEAGGFVLFLGRIVPEKEIDTLVRAFRRVPGDLRLAVVGPGTHSDGYVQDVERLAAADARVVMLGPRYGGEKTWLLQNAAAFIQPSAVEGLPIALLEAMACGRTCVVSDIPEHLEVIHAGDEPLAAVFRVGDEADLAATLTAALDDRRREAVAEAGRRHVLATYGWDPVAEQTEREYAAALEAA
jgi:glycosyltransferase involved in cell wall biosynthesis